MANPTTGILDTFTDSNGTDLDVHGTWMLINGTLETQNNLVRGTSAVGPNRAWWDAQKFGPNSEAYATLKAKTTNRWMGLYLRMSDLTNFGNGYALLIDFTSGLTEWTIKRVDSGTQTQLGSLVEEATLTNDVIFFEAIGNTFKGYKNGFEIISRTDSNYSAEGYVGLELARDAVDADDFGGGLIPSAEVVVPLINKGPLHVFF